ncbi:MAG: outer-membrane lipoprotein carrier protein LolA, partial [Alphaproteobacteria bacterium]|nr:outer-membrane lipoprotein carrier protein LolA [Alphaproteobacteria bacterium]
DIGPITLVFSNSPFELKQWKIIDPQNIEVTISLFNASKDASLDEDLFKFKNPRKNKRRRR